MAERLGRYNLVKRLAAGGMGEVFIAELNSLSGFAKRVALKRIGGEMARDPTYVEMFLNEARVGSFLNHPNIVHIFDVGHHDGVLWLVMEYVNGVDLRRLLRRAELGGQRVTEPVLAAIAVEILTALEEAHGGGPNHEPIIHRDISPENVIVATSGAIKVLDFGLAKWSPGRVNVPSKEGQKLFGKLPYMSPEQLRGEAVGPPSDIYAVGVLLYEALRGELPFDGLTPHIVHKAILESRPPSPTASSPNPQPELDAIVMRALAPDPNHRYDTAAEMRRELVRYLREYHLVLPLEQLRSLLRPGQPLSRPVEVTSELSEIALTSALNCGKCGGSFRGMFFDGMLLDRCSECRGVWLDQSEVIRILGSEHQRDLLGRHATERAPLDSVVGSCPVDQVGLRPLPVPDHPARFELCPVCGGLWLDRGELQLLQQQDVVDWLRDRLLELLAAQVPAR